MVLDNIIVDNRAARGGGFDFCFFLGSLPPPILHANTIRNNEATESGGGIYSYVASPNHHFTTLDGNSAPQGGGVYSDSQSDVRLHNSIVSNSGQGGGLMAAAGTIQTETCDVWNNAGGNYINCQPAPTDLSCDPGYCPVGSEEVLPLYETSCCQGAAAGGYDIGAAGVECFTLPGVFFFDNFSDQNDDGWQVELLGDAGMQVASGAYSGFAETLWSYARSTVVPTGDVWTDYRVRIKLRMEPSVIEPAGWCDVYFRYDGDQRFYRVRLDGVRGELWKQLGETLILLAEFDCPLPGGGAWARFEFTACQSFLRGVRRDETGADLPLFSLHDSHNPILEGTVGVGVESAGMPWQAIFDDVLVARPDPAAVFLPDAPALPALTVRPNPFTAETAIDFRLTLAGAVSVELFTVQGTLLRRLLSGPLPAGAHQVRWDGCDARGQQAPAAVYFVTVRSGEERVRGRVLRLR
jgi:hypothetical protein